jgi:hypothetical protein
MRDLVDTHREGGRCEGEEGVAADFRALLARLASGPSNKPSMADRSGNTSAPGPRW